MKETETYIENRNFLKRILNKKVNFQNLILNSGLMLNYLGQTNNNREVFEIKNAVLYISIERIDIIPEEGINTSLIKSRLEDTLKIKLIPITKQNG